ncbi:MAG: FtsX-like permease family protein [Acidobacteria bacterium]|nr:FtsX-like permease family protein [Acidobacteriota bacterium]MYJ09744.1 FtsX-like permease family protein [Gemmatimonadota bacterium]
MARLRAAWIAGWRSLTAAPGNTATIVGVLILAVGASQSVTAIWVSVTDRSLPYENPGQLVVLSSTRPTPGSFERLSDHEVALLSGESSAFVWLGQFLTVDRTLGDDDRRSVRVGIWPPEALEALGVRPAQGRDFVPDDHESGRPSGQLRSVEPETGRSVVLLAHEFWQSAFGASPDVVGSEIVLDNRAFEVIGVMPVGFLAPNPTEVMWIPARRKEPELGASRYALTVGRLQSGTAVQAAGAEATAVLQNAGFRTDGERITAISLTDQLTASVRPTLELLMIGAILLVAMAAISVFGLRLSRVAAERTRWDRRRSLGASWADQVGAATSRMLCLGVAVAAGSTLVAYTLIPLFRSYGAALPFAREWDLAGSAIPLALLTVIAVTVVAEAPLLFDGLRHRRLVSGRAWATMRPGLLTAAGLTLGCAAATMMLTATAVVGGSAWALLTVRSGYDDRQLVQLTVDFGGLSGESTLPYDSEVALLAQLRERFERRVDVEAAAFADSLPDQAGGSRTFPTSSPGTWDRSSGRATRRVSATLFDVLRIPVLEGRGFRASDTVISERVAVLDQSYAAGLSESESALNRSFLVETARARIVGIVPDIRIFPGEESVPTAYVPYSIPPVLRGVRTAEVVVRLRDEPSAGQMAALARVPPTVDPSLRTLRVASVRARRIGRLGAPVLGAVALGAFAVAGVLLAVGGGVGQVADFASRRKYEIAVRAALGADPEHIAWIALRGAATNAVAGVSLGTLGGWILCRVLASRVPWVDVSEPLQFLGPGALLLLLLLLASGLTSLTTRRIPVWPTLRSL